MLLKKTDMTGRRGRRRKQPLDYRKETRRYWKLKEEALDRTVWEAGFGRGCGPVARHVMASWSSSVISLGPDLCSESSGTRACTFASIHTHTHIYTHAQTHCCSYRHSVAHICKKGSDHIVKPRSELCRISKQVT